MPRDLLYSEAEPLPLVQGVIANTPATPASSLYVTIPSYPDPTARWGPVAWSPRGGALPAAGNRCLLARDEHGLWWLVSWVGAWAAPAPGGAAGGDLAGTYPNPTLAAATLTKFLQLVSPQDLQAAVGAASFTGTGAATVVAGVNTGLPRAPAFGIVVPSASPAGNWYAQSYTYTGAPSVISFTAKNDGGLFSTGVAFNYFWLAIG